MTTILKAQVTVNTDQEHNKTFSEWLAIAETEKYAGHKQSDSDRVFAAMKSYCRKKMIAGVIYPDGGVQNDGLAQKDVRATYSPPEKVTFKTQAEIDAD